MLRVIDSPAPRHVARYRDDRHAAPGNCRSYRNLRNARHLLGLRDHFAIMAAPRKEMLGMCLLEVPASDLDGWNLRGDCHNWNAAALALVEAVDQMQVPRTAASGADCQSPGQVRFCAGGKRGRLFVSYVNPLELPANAN